MLYTTYKVQRGVCCYMLSGETSPVPHAHNLSVLLFEKNNRWSDLEKDKRHEKPERTRQKEKHCLSGSALRDLWLYPYGCCSTDGN